MHLLRLFYNSSVLTFCALLATNTLGQTSVDCAPDLVHSAYADHSLSGVSDLERRNGGGGATSNPGDPSGAASALLVDNADLARKTLGLVDFTHLSGPELNHRIQVSRVQHKSLFTSAGHFTLLT